MRTPDETTFEIGQAKLRLRSGLRFSFHQSGADFWYLVEDEVHSALYRIGLPEYTLLSLLNGERTLSRAISETAMRLGDQAFDEQTAAALSQWVVESALAETDASKSFHRVTDRIQQRTQVERLSFLNPISTRIKLLDPDSIVARVEDGLGWLVSWPCAIIYLIVVLLAAILMLDHWSEFTLGRVETFSSNDLFWLALCWLLVKSIHEMAHGVVCKRFGGRVSQFGILFLLLIPLPYVDVTSSWSFEDKYKRILTAAAGMLAELFVASLAVFVWLYAEPGPIRYHAGNLIITATLHTLIFNVNPLMKFDGYYMLSDWLEIPNLYTRGRQHVKGIARKVFYGLNSQTEFSRSRNHWMIVLYGWASSFWFCLICVSLGLGAISLLHGFGLLIGLVAIVFWFVIPFLKILKFVLFGSETQQPNRFQFTAVVAGITVAMATLLLLAPAPSTISAPVVVEYDPITTVRTETSGFISQICIEAGQSVAQGEQLFRLENPDLETELEVIKIDQAKSELKLRQYKRDGNVAGCQQQRKFIESTKRRRKELEQLVSKLSIVAPVHGIITSRDLSSRKGTFVEAGAELVTLGQANSLRLISMISQQDAPYFHRKDTEAAQLRQCESRVITLQSSDQQPRFVRSSKDAVSNDPKRELPSTVRFKIAGTYGGKYTTRISSIRPKATDALPHAAFAANYGGPLSVVNREQTERKGHETKGPSLDADADIDQLKLTYPCLEISLHVPEALVGRLHAGQVGYAQFSKRDVRLGQYLFENSIRFLRRNIFKTHGL